MRRYLIGADRFYDTGKQGLRRRGKRPPPPTFLQNTGAFSKSFVMGAKFSLASPPHFPTCGGTHGKIFILRLSDILSILLKLLLNKSTIGINYISEVTVKVMLGHYSRPRKARISSNCSNQLTLFIPFE